MANLDQCDSTEAVGSHIQHHNTTDKVITVGDLKSYSTYVIYVKAIATNGKIGEEQIVFATTDEKGM